MIKKIVKTDEPRLREVSKSVTKVDKKILNLVTDLKDTLLAQKDPEGVGLAAPQLGKNIRVFVIRDKGEVKTIINPEIISIDKKAVLNSKGEKKDKIMEGCLSLPHYYGPLKRPLKLKLKYLDVTGKQRIEVFEGFPAQIAQHEIDHLNGVLFVDKLLEQKKPLYKQKDNEWVEVEL